MNSFYVTILFLFPLILSAGTIIVKTKAPHNRQSGEKNIRILPEHSEERHRWSDNPSAPDQRTIWFYRDSFGDAVLPYLTQIFRRTDSYYRNVPIRRSQFANQKKRPHIVVFQIVERNLREVLTPLILKVMRMNGWSFSGKNRAMSQTDHVITLLIFCQVINK